MVLSAENVSDAQVDWELFEDLCVFEADIGDFDRSGAEASSMEIRRRLIPGLEAINRGQALCDYYD